MTDNAFALVAAITTLWALGLVIRTLADDRRARHASIENLVLSLAALTGDQSVPRTRAVRQRATAVSRERSRPAVARRR
ncbi:MAG: hypothetical protein CFE37_05240 [Alphaproteobacteria bacterium PA4]|nr:MAG: hypothetical protein CFE37_05240 [Alphaproteobacteria bacterium PA4]